MGIYQVTSKFQKIHSGCKVRSGYQLRVAFNLTLLVLLSCASSSAGRKTRQLQSSVSSVSFVNVVAGTTSQQVVTYTSTGNANANVNGVTVTGSGFSYSGPALPVTLLPGQSLSITIAYSPTVTGASTGTLQLSSNATVTTALIPLSGSGAPQAPSLSFNPSTIAFGNVPAGSVQSLTVSLSNSGGSPMDLSQATLTGAGFTMSGLSMPLTLAANQTSSFTVSFQPLAAGAASGTISLVSNAANSLVKIAVSGTGTQPQISVIPPTVNFGNLAVGLTNSQTIAVSNPGNANLSVMQSAGPGTGFSISGLTLPLTVAPGASATFTLSFHPASSGSLASNAVLVSNAPGSPTTIPVNGTGMASVNQLSAGAPSLNFGTELLGTTSTQNMTLTNTGTVNVTISQISASPASFTATAPALPITLSSGQSSTFGLSFTPAVVGSVTGSASVISTAANSPLSLPLSGAGSQGSHSVALDWTASPSAVVGYFVYSGKVASGPFTRLTPTPVSITSYTDDSVQSGQTYYYVATAVDSTGMESAYSNEVSATIP